MSTPLLTDVHSLIDLLEFRAQKAPDLTAFRFLDEPCTYGDMWRDINRFASYLLDSGIEAGQRVVLTLPNSAEFFAAFYGVQRAGAIAVPLYPGLGMEHVLDIVQLCGARSIVVPSLTPQSQRVGLEEQAARHNVSVLTVKQSDSHPQDSIFPNIHPDQVAFIQYTSGSTGNPKGVLLSHRNLLTNVKQMISGMEITPDDVFVSWLPVYHDMGLILKTMVPFYLAARLVLLPTSLKNVHAWLSAIQHHCATFIAAPDFAYRLCLRYVKHPERYDLSSLRVALNAAEPVRSQTIHDFEKTFGLSHVMVAGYGLAEATVGVSMGQPMSPVKADKWGNVSVGHPFPDVEVKIVDDRHLVEPGTAGEIVVKSPANTRGYYNNPEQTERLFWRDGHILSGDIGYIDDEGELFIVGRKKNTIVNAGRSMSSREIEEIVDQLPAVRSAAAIGVDKGNLEGEQVYIFAEVRGANVRTEREQQDVIIEIVESVRKQLGFRPGRVYLVKPKTIPLTHNGKMQHQRLREYYLNHHLFERGRIIYPNYE